MAIILCKGAGDAVSGSPAQVSYFLAAHGLAAHPAAAQGFAAQDFAPHLAAAHGLAEQPEAAQGFAAQPSADTDSSTGIISSVTFSLGSPPPEQALVAMARPPATASIDASLTFFMIVLSQIPLLRCAPTMRRAFASWILVQM